MAEITVYLCPDPWKGPGLSYEKLGAPLRIRTPEGEGYTQLEVHLLPNGFSPADTIFTDLCPSGREELECLTCLRREEPDIGQKSAQLLEMLNAQREAHSGDECQNCSPLEWDERCHWGASLAAQDLGTGVTIEPGIYAQHAGVSYLHLGILTAWIPKAQGIEVSGAELETVVAGWMDDPASRARVLNALYKRAGISFFFTLNPRGWWLAVLLADQAVQSTDPGTFTDPAALPCAFSCMKRLQYYRRKVAEVYHNEPVLSDFITFRWTNPPLCNLWKVELTGDVRGARAIWLCPNEPPAQGCRSEVAPSRADTPIIGGWTQEFEMRDKPPYPGELFTVWGYLDGMDPGSACNPILIAACFYSHFCHTSGTITSIRLMEGETVVDERLTGSTPDEWASDVRLRYQVQCEGRTLTVIPSDFARYTVGDRAVIHKGGVHTLQTLDGDREEAGCQDPEGGTEHDLLRWDLCRPFPDHVDGAIIPQRFWGLY